MKYLVTGLGNIGQDYANTRHNIGFNILDALAAASNISFSDKRYGFVSELKYKSRSIILLKPSTYMNLSGKAVNYWMQKEKIPLDNIIVVVDDLALNFGQLRLKTSGGDGGHNGLSNIIDILGTNKYARLRFGIGNNFYKGQQIDYVLSEWSEEEKKLLPERIEICHEIIKSFCTIGIERTMNQFNNK